MDDSGIQLTRPIVADINPKSLENAKRRSFIEDGGARLKQLRSQLRAQGTGTFRFPKVHPAEIPKECLETLGFRAAS